MSELALLKLTGVLASLWMFAGVVLVARRYPGYSHKNQVMSELGAIGRPTAKIHPLVNNYPIATLFVLFGTSIAITYWENWTTIALGLLIIVHGLCHAVTGLFPCDQDLGVPEPSATQIIHNIAGLLMLVALLAASSLSAVSSMVAAPSWFRGFSATCLLISMVFAIFMARSLATGHNLGLYQRISYGALLVWVAVFSGMIFSNT